MPTFRNANQALNLQELIRSEFELNFDTAEQRIKAYQYLLQKIDAIFDEKQETAVNALYTSLDTNIQNALSADKQSIGKNIERLAQIVKLVVLPVVVDDSPVDGGDAKQQQLQQEKRERDKIQKQVEAEYKAVEALNKDNNICWYLRECERTRTPGEVGSPIAMAKNILGFIKQLIQLELLKEQNELLNDKTLPNDETAAKILSAAASHQPNSNAAAATAAKDLKEDPNHPELQIQKLALRHKAKQIVAEAKKQADFAELEKQLAIARRAQAAASAANSDSKQNSLPAQLNIDMATVTPEMVRDKILANELAYTAYVLNNGFSANEHAKVSNEAWLTKPLIYFAVHSRSLPMVKLLVEHGAKIKPENRYGLGNLAIIEAIGINDTNIAIYLLEKGANAREEFRAIPFLVKALENNNIALVESLIKHGASAAYAISYLFERRRSPEELYRNRVQILMDYNIGADFYNDKILDQLFIIDISGINFVGMSIEGHPITRQMLVARNLKGAENAIVTVADIKKLQDKQRSQALETRLQIAIKKYGTLISDDGVVNLVPFSKAVEIGDTAAVQARLSVADTNPNTIPDSKLIPIVEAAKNGHVVTVKFLASHPKIDKRDFVAAYSAATELADSKIGAAIGDFIFLQQSVTARDKEGNTLLHLAAQSGNVTQVIACIDRKADVNAENKDQETPLLLAVKQLSAFDISAPPEYIQIIKILLENGANANQYYYSSPLAHAANAASVEAIALLLPHTKPKNIIWKDYSRDVTGAPWYVDMIFNALSSRKWQIIWNLFKPYQINFAIKNQYGRSLFHEAIDSERPEAIAFLLANDARPNITDKNGHTPLEYLLQEVYLKIDEDDELLPKWEKVIILLVKYGDTAELPAVLKAKVAAKIATTSLADFEDDMKSAATTAAALVMTTKAASVSVDAKQAAATAPLPSAAQLTAAASRSSPLHTAAASADAKAAAKAKTHNATAENPPANQGDKNQPPPSQCTVM